MVQDERHETTTTTTSDASELPSAPELRSAKLHPERRCARIVPLLLWLTKEPRCARARTGLPLSQRRALSRPGVGGDGEPSFIAAVRRWSPQGQLPLSLEGTRLMSLHKCTKCLVRGTNASLVDDSGLLCSPDDRRRARREGSLGVSLGPIRNGMGTGRHYLFAP
jgi:hypothetical protein